MSYFSDEDEKNVADFVTLAGEALTYLNEMANDLCDRIDYVGCDACKNGALIARHNEIRSFIQRFEKAKDMVDFE
jgi:hypothetical protein